MHVEVGEMTMTLAAARTRRVAAKILMGLFRVIVNLMLGFLIVGAVLLMWLGSVVGPPLLFLYGAFSIVTNGSALVLVLWLVPTFLWFRFFHAGYLLPELYRASGTFVRLLQAMNAIFANPDLEYLIF